MKARIINSQANELNENKNDIQEEKEMSKKEIREAQKALNNCIDEAAEAEGQTMSKKDLWKAKHEAKKAVAKATAETKAELRSAKRDAKRTARADKITAKLDAKAELALNAQDELIRQQAEITGMDYDEYREMTKEATVDILRLRREKNLKVAKIVAASSAAVVGAAAATTVAVSIHKKNSAKAEQ